MRYLIIGDVHLADRPPSSRTDTYREDILVKLEWCIDKANELGVDAVLQLGDWFHVKRPDRTSHGLVKRAADICGKSEAPVIIVVGNHCIQNDDLDSVPSQPLGTLALHPNVELLMGGHSTLPVYGVPYVDPQPENLKYWVDKYHEDGGPDKYPLIITHQAIFPMVNEPIYDFVSAEDWAEHFKAPYVAYGHIHEPMKIGWNFEIGGTHFLNRGSLSRGSLTEHNLKRKVGVVLFDDSNPEQPYTEFLVPIKPAHEVFKLDVVEAMKERQNKVDTFLASLGSEELQYLTIEGILEEAKSNKDLSKPALKELEDIIENVATE